MTQPQTELVERLRQRARGLTMLDVAMAQAKFQVAATPEQTLEWQAADALESSLARESAARREEREACARIAESQGALADNTEIKRAHISCATHIAKLIRSRAAQDKETE